MEPPNAEYQALHRVITADKRFRRFQYALALIFFGLVLFGGYQIQKSIEHKIDQVVAAAAVSGETRRQESKTISKETTRYITCIFVLPVELRTPDNQEKCFKASDLPGGLNRDDFSPIIVNSNGTVELTGAAQGQSSVVSIYSFPNNEPVPEAPQSNTSQDIASAPSPSQPESETPAAIEPEHPSFLDLITLPVKRLIGGL